MHSAYIGNLTVSSRKRYIVYGDVRGLVSAHMRRHAAIESARLDQVHCGRLGGGAYSDASVYEWSEENGWQPIDTYDD